MMLRLLDTEFLFLKKILGVKSRIVPDDDIDFLLDELDDWIIANGFNDDYSLNDEGRKAQNMYDAIYYRNTYEDED